MNALTGYRSRHTHPGHDSVLRMIWAWIDGQWVEAHVEAEGRDSDGWDWVWVSSRGGWCWVLQARTAERTLSPADLEASRVRVEAAPGSEGSYMNRARGRNPHRPQ